jgi:hypothetical protein
VDDPEGTGKDEKLSSKAKSKGKDERLPQKERRLTVSGGVANASRARRCEPLAARAPLSFPVLSLL